MPIATAGALETTSPCVGTVISSQFVLIGQGQMTAYSNLVGDPNPIHVDIAAAKAAGFEKTVAQGLLVLGIASGLASQLTEQWNPVRIFRLIKEWKFSKPVFAGDQIMINIQVSELQEFRGGLMKAVLSIHIWNEKREKVQSGIWEMLIGNCPPAPVKPVTAT